MNVAISLLALFVISSGYLINNAFAEVSENQAFLLEGSGFAVTQESIKSTEIDLALSSQQHSGSSINFLAEDGFVTLNDEEFVISDLKGKFLRGGNYMRINGNVESSTGFDTSISFFGRLVDESKDASVYGFTGRITTSDDTYKIIYTTKLSKLSKITATSTESTKTNNLTIHILKGASAQGVSNSYIGIGAAQTTSDPTKLRYFSQDRISVQPGATITVTNDDVVSHNIISGKEKNDRYIPFTPDGKISTGVIEPGKSVDITFGDAGFYRLYDPDYVWMKIIAYVFPDSDTIVIKDMGKAKN